MAFWNMAITYHFHKPPSNAELSKNSSTFENSEFANQSIKEILRGGYKRTLHKIINHFLMSTGG